MTTIGIQRALRPLVGLPLRSFSRAANLLRVAFGELEERRCHDGKRRTLPEWALHVSCPWRLCHHRQIVVAYHDFYHTRSGNYLDDDEWDTSGKSRFDSVAKRLRPKFETSPPVVGSVEAVEFGGFSMIFDRGYLLDVFPDSSDPQSEHWRVFRDGGKHFVVKGAR